MAESEKEEETSVELLFRTAVRAKSDLDRYASKVSSWWRDLHILAKLAIWAPIQGILFKIQPQLWAGITLISDIIIYSLGFLFGGVVTLKFTTQLLLVLIALFTIQTTLLSLRLRGLERKIEEHSTTIEDILWTVENIEWEVEDITMDGGQPETPPSDEEEPNTSGTGAVGGAVAGGALGATVGGPAGALGGAFLGLILGDEFEKNSIKQQKKLDIKKEVINELLLRDAISPSFISKGELRRGFPDVKERLLDESFQEMVDNPTIPVTENRSGIAITDREEAREYLRHR